MRGRVLYRERGALRRVREGRISYFKHFTTFYLFHLKDLPVTVKRQRACWEDINSQHAAHQRTPIREPSVDKARPLMGETASTVRCGEMSGNQ